MTSRTHQVCGGVVCLVWILAATLPFALIGETWGMAWFLSNLPLSACVEQSAGIGAASHALVAGVSLVNGIVLGALTFGFLRLRRWFLGPESKYFGPFGELGPEEHGLEGRWLVTERFGRKRVVSDAAEQRIRWLVEERLERIASDESGWDTLLRDPRDGRWWELTYPYSGMQGGGPLHLNLIAESPARQKYGSEVIRSTVRSPSGT